MWSLGTMLAVVGAVFVGAAAVMVAIDCLPEAEAWHDHEESWNRQLVPHHTWNEDTDGWDRYWSTKRVITAVGTLSQNDPFHYEEAFRKAVEGGYLAHLWFPLPNQNGSDARILIGNTTTYVEGVIANATAPHEAAGALPVTTRTLTVLGADSAPYVASPVPSNYSLYPTPYGSPDDYSVAPTGHYAGVTSPRTMVVPHDVDTIYVHNAGDSAVNMTITGLDGRDHSHTLMGSSTFVLPADDYDYTIAGGEGYALAWNGTIRNPNMS